MAILFGDTSQIFVIPYSHWQLRCCWQGDDSIAPILKAGSWDGKVTDTYTYCVLPHVQVTPGKHNAAQHNTKVCKIWRARECVYGTFSYSLCSGSHLLLPPKPNSDQLFSTLIYRDSEGEALLYCLFRLRTCQVHCKHTQDLKTQC